MDSLLVKSVKVSSLDRCLLKRRNVDFLLGEVTVAIYTPDDDTPKQLKGMREGSTELPCEPKEEKMESTSSDAVRKGVPNSPVLLLTWEGTVGVFSSAPLIVATIYVPGWGITRDSRHS